MVEIIYSAVGVLAVLALLFTGGVVLGWKAGERFHQQQRRAAARELSDREERRGQEDAQAFSLLMGYNADLAYGVTAPEELMRERGHEGNGA